MNNFKTSLLKRPKLAFAFFILLGMACGPSMDMSEFISYFQPESAHFVKAQDKAYYYTPERLFMLDEQPEGESDNDSAQVVAEWTKFFEGKASASSIAAYLYNAEEQLVLEKNTDVINFTEIKKDIAAFTFEEWTEDGQLREAPLLKIEDYKKQFNAAKSAFMKERIGFQVMRAMATIGKHKDVLDFYEKDFLPISSKSSVALRAKARVAGSRIFAGNKAQAFYEFAQMFDQNPSLRTSSDLSVRVQGVRFSEEAIQFCKNDHEKVSVYVLASIQPNQDALNFIEKILQLEPQNPMLEFLMAREISRNEFFYHTKNKTIFYEEPTNFDAKNSLAKSYVSKLSALAQSAAANQKTARPAFWLTAAAHCDYLDNNSINSRKLLDAATALKPTETPLQDQILLQETLLFAKENKQITKENELKIMPLIEKLNLRKNFRQTNMLVEASRLLSELYKGKSTKAIKSGGWLSGCSKKGEIVSYTASGIPFANAKSLLFAMLTTSEFGPKDKEGYPVAYTQSLSNLGFIEDSTSSKSIKELLLFVDQTNPNEVDKGLIKLLNKDDLNEMLARRYVAEHQYAAAIETFEKVPASAWKNDKYDFEFTKNPFNIYQSAKGLADTALQYSPESFIKKMAELSTKNDAESLYYLACGTYNLSYFGNSWVLVRSYKTVDEIGKVPGYYANPWRDMKDDFYQLNTAKANFEKALQGTTDRELKAKIYYGLALIERTKFTIEYAQNEPIYEDDFDKYEANQKKHEVLMNQKRKDYYSNFAIIKSQFLDTKFQSELLKECSTYEHFVTGK